MFIFLQNQGFGSILLVFAIFMLKMKGVAT